ncbi:hypothetical protein NLK61_26145 [Pseudomonas fuscovaginae UPB0736]|uniref:DUF6124 family protein n=1 Tax=Pseudomonas asplenii TaxID=53407 RepID=UPI000289BF04|nr:hypothetical protein [Pseudomonas fuscovaginae]UUQ64645.1 hypothetical protein NLK61_26145 [Pseudomonas fuscovaginae UPB0736]
MFKVTPNPPPGFQPQQNSAETTLVTVYSILQAAAATAYENADNQAGPNRNVAMGVVHLIELAQWWVDSLLDKPLAADANSQVAQV